MQYCILIKREKCLWVEVLQLNRKVPSSNHTGCSASLGIQLRNEAPSDLQVEIRMKMH